jgi:selenocysteine lyase/cysteine desulfurase
MPQIVLDTVVGHLQREATIGGYEAAWEADDRSKSVYASAARLIGAAPDEIALVENATRAWDMAFYAIPFQPGDVILTAQAEYASNVIAFLQMRERGIGIRVVPNDEHGQMSLAALEQMLDSRVRLVAVSHMPTNGGLVQPVEAIGRLARANGSLYLVDACQSAGQAPLHAEAIGCDMLSATSRKYLRGPRGAGLLYVRRDLIAQLEPPFLDLHAASWVAADRYTIREDAGRFENWERNVAGLLGMGAAIDLALDIGVERIWETVRRTGDALRQRLSAIPGVTVTDVGAIRSGIVTFAVAGVDPQAIERALRAEAVNVVTSSVFSTRFDMEQRGLEQIVRASVHYLTTEDEIEVLLAVVGRFATAATATS